MAPSLTSSDAHESSSSSSSVSVVAYSDDEFVMMPRLGAAEADACASGALGAVAPFIWPVWAFVGGCGSTGERGGGREGPTAFGALSTFCWGGGRALVMSFRITCTWRLEFSRVRAGRKGGFLERRPRPVGWEDADAALARV